MLQCCHLVHSLYENNFANFYLYLENHRKKTLALDAKINLMKMSKIKTGLDKEFSKFTDQNIDSLTYSYCLARHIN